MPVSFGRFTLRPALLRRALLRRALLRGALLRGALLAVALLCAACGSSGGGSAPAAADSTAAEQGENEDGPAYRYEAFADGMLTDTLRGAAEFGLVFNPKTRLEYWVLTMRAGGDVTSGLYLSRPDTTRPQVGTYEITERPPLGEGEPRAGASSGRADSLHSSSSGFSMIYRTGMRRSFVSQSGSVELTTANDSLLEGTFRANMQGTASQPGEPPREGRLRLRGSFRAEKGTVGFIFGI